MVRAGGRSCDEVGDAVSHCDDLVFYWGEMRSREKILSGGTMWPNVCVESIILSYHR